MEKCTKHKLYIPDLEEISKVLKKGLSSIFTAVDVEVVDCPNLKEKPFMLASEGLCGRPCLADVGGVPYLVPLARKDKVYDMKELAKQMNLPNAFIIGAGAGPRHHVGVNCEMMANVKLGNDAFNNTHVAKIEGQGCQLIHLKESTEFCLLGNLFVSEGKSGKVIKATARNRKAPGNFVTAMRKALADHYKEKPVGVGGVFVIQKGKAKLHIMVF